MWKFRKSFTLAAPGIRTRFIIAAYHSKKDKIVYFWHKGDTKWCAQQEFYNDDVRVSWMKEGDPICPLEVVVLTGTVGPKEKEYVL